MRKVTEKQIKFIETLIAERQVSDEAAADIRRAFPVMTTLQASYAIDGLKKYPRRTAAQDNAWVDPETTVAENVDPGTQIQDQDKSIWFRSGGKLTASQCETVDVTMAIDALYDTEDEAEKARIRIDIENIKAAQGVMV